MPATINHVLSMTTPDDPAYEKEQKRLAQNAANRASYEKHKAARQAKCREYQRKRHAEKPEHVKALAKAWNEANKDRVSARRKIIRPKYKDKEIAYAKEWARNNPEKIIQNYLKHKEKFRERYRAWSKANPDKEAARAANRRAVKRGATPTWADLNQIKSFYELAAKKTKETGVEHEVDHIVPLRGKLVCGLHCEYNLQVITMVENAAKGNRYAC